MKILIIDTGLAEEFAIKLKLEGNDVLYSFPQFEAHPSQLKGSTRRFTLVK
jgi:hypothetical protein